MTVARVFAILKCTMKPFNFKTDIVILGAGLGGYEAFRTLARHIKRLGLDKKITIVDKNNYFTFVPMLHEVASGSILPTHAAVPLKELTYKTAHQFVRAEITHVDPKKKKIETNEGIIFYDFCIVAMGSTTNFFNTPGADTFAFHVRDLNAALDLQNEFIKKMDKCDEDNKFYVTIVGGGFTGVEVAGQFCDLAEGELKRLYPNKKVYIQLIQGMQSLLPQSPKKMQMIAENRLRKKGVDIFFESYAQEVTEHSVVLSNGNTLTSDMTIWTAGFKNIAPKFFDEDICSQGRIPVNQFLQHQSHHSLYAVGDVALFYNMGEEKPIPQLGEAAYAGGKYAARHIISVMRDETLLRPFKFKTKGTLMPIGDWFGIAHIGPFIFSGRLAWWIRRTLYLWYMPGIRRKLSIVFDWTIHSFGSRNIIDIQNK